MTFIHQICTNRSWVLRRKLSLGEADVKQENHSVFCDSIPLVRS